MLAKQLKNIIHSLGQRKELIAIYCFEEYLCDVFLSTKLLDPQAAENWTDYLTLAAYCFLLFIGLGISHVSRRKTRKVAPSKSAFQVMINKLQKLQQRFPIGMALASILLVLGGEILEQALIENINGVLPATPPFILFFIAFPLVNLFTPLIDFLICLPFLITVLLLARILRRTYYAISWSTVRIEVQLFLARVGLVFSRRERLQYGLV